jgi:hypothetical protein
MIQIMTTTSNIDIPREMKFPTTILIYKFVIFFSGASKASGREDGIFLEKNRKNVLINTQTNKK